MPNWKKVVVSGSDALLNSVTASFTGSLTGALIGTASWAQSASNAISSQNATSADSAKTIATVSSSVNAVFYPTFVDSNNSPTTNESLFTSEVLISIVNSISADVIANAGSGTNGNIGTLEYKV